MSVSAESFLQVSQALMSKDGEAWRTRLCGVCWAGPASRVIVSSAPSGARRRALMRASSGYAISAVRRLPMPRE